MNAAVYLRVSSPECKRCGRLAESHPHAGCKAFDGRQDEANQEPDCARLAEARGWTPLYFRERMSGAKQRPVWDSVKDAVRTGRVRAVVFWALDRTGRDRVQIAHDLGELWRWGAQVASVKDAWVDQPPGPLRDLLLQLMAWFASAERARLQERTRAGMARARDGKADRPRAHGAGARPESSAVPSRRRTDVDGWHGGAGAGRGGVRQVPHGNDPLDPQGGAVKLARFRVVGRLDMASRPTEGTVIIDRAAGLFSVRPLRRRRLYTLPLSTVAELVCRGIIAAEVRERRAARKRR